MFDYRVFNHDLLSSLAGMHFILRCMRHVAFCASRGGILWEKDAADALAAQQGMLSAMFAGKN
ncbi:hypothetical protein [Paraburkholderia sp. DHOC27]|uniref:hypothetical protein n=1 Tax=Paraburkholderia sp. DHOC27 TaxID=2303330 RepID=UPI0015F33631|nr:hypothetical protein [Paraburkholderia sp. DHOC27]